MGKRKKSARSKMAGKKAKMAPLDKSFRCQFCQNPGTVSCKLDKSSGFGTLVCSACNQTFTHKINALSEPIDLYSEWIDACEAVNADDEPSNHTLRDHSQRLSKPSGASKRRRDEDEDDDAALPDFGGGGGSSGKRRRVQDDDDDDGELPDFGQ